MIAILSRVSMFYIGEGVGELGSLGRAGGEVKTEGQRFTYAGCEESDTAKREGAATAARSAAAPDQPIIFRPCSAHCRRRWRAERSIHQSILTHSLLTARPAMRTRTHLLRVRVHVVVMVVVSWCASEVMLWWSCVSDLVFVCIWDLGIIGVCIRQ